MDPTQIQPQIEGQPMEGQMPPQMGGQMPPQMGGQPMGGQMPPQMAIDPNQPISEEQKQALLDMIGQIRSKLGSLNANKFAAGNKTELLRQELLKQTFEKLQAAGVDLSSRESVAAFIMKLQQENPELAAIFEKSMDTLLGGPSGGAFGTPQDPNAELDLGIPPQNNMNNINQDETIPQDFSGPG